MDADRPRPPLVVESRYCGPPGSANGGYVAGLLAARVRVPAAATDDRGLESPAVEVTLRQPPPLDTPMQVVDVDAVTRLTFGGALIAEARVVDLQLEPVDPVPFETALAAQSSYAGLSGHPFPQCFSCGSDRTPPDSLGLRPGQPGDVPGITACTWRPAADLADESGLVRPEVVWAALDCPGGWTVDIVGRPAVLGRITAQVDARPPAGEPCVVMGRLLGREGRKAFAATTLYDGDGRVLARAASTWIEVDPATAGRRS